MKREVTDGVSSLPATPRSAQNFYPTYPMPPHPGANAMPPLQSPMHPPHSTMSTRVARDGADDDHEEDRKRKLFGDVPEAKRRKFILVEDKQRGTRVRVRLVLDQVKMDDMPDAHLKTNSVYPRSFYPRHDGSPTDSSRALPIWDGDDDDCVEGASSTLPTRGKTMVQVPLMDGSEMGMSVPSRRTSQRRKEMTLNEIGYRMSWGQARAFNGRTLFLQRSC